MVRVLTKKVWAYPSFDSSTWSVCLLKATAPFMWGHKDVMISITSIKEWLDTFLTLVML
jgi:hypothetical protein